MPALALALLLLAAPALADPLADLRAANGAYAGRQYALAIAAYDRALAAPGLSARNRALALYTRGLAKAALGRYAAAVGDFTLVLAMQPDHVEALNSRGLAQAALGRHEAAVADYTAAIRYRPAFAYAWNNRGVSRVALGRLDAALEDYYRAIEHGHAAPHLVYYNRARLLELRGETGRALRDLREAARLAPGYRPALEALAEYRALKLAD